MEITTKVDKVETKDIFCSQCGQELKKTLKNHIAVILDQSSSMGSIRDQAIGLFNEQIDTIRKEASDMENKVTLVTFASQVNDPTYDSVDLDNVPNLDHNNYSPNGMTALHDAIGATVERLSNKDTNKEDAFLVIIITGGMENMSKDFDGAKIKELIQTKEKSGNWTFTFLGANQDISLTQKSLGLSVQNVASFNATQQGTIRGAGITSDGLKDYMSARRVGAKQVTNFYAGDQNEDQDKKGD